MTRLRRGVVLAVFGLFVLTVALRPISRLAGAVITEDGLDPGGLALAAPAVVVAAVAVVAGASLLLRGRRQPTEVGSTGVEQRDSSEPASDRAEPSVPERERNTAPSQRPTSILTGQGGTRNRGFEIEEKPPGVAVDDHLAYLSDQLGEDALADGPDADDRTEGDRVREGTERGGEPTGRATAEADCRGERHPDALPVRCPKPHCDANWHAGLLGGGGSYEVLEGNQIRCTECNAISRIE